MGISRGTVLERIPVTSTAMMGKGIASDSFIDKRRFIIAAGFLD
jgi:hypothetical protein